MIRILSYHVRAVLKRAITITSPELVYLVTLLFAGLLVATNAQATKDGGPAFAPIGNAGIQDIASCAGQFAYFVTNDVTIDDSEVTVRFDVLHAIFNINISSVRVTLSVDAVSASITITSIDFPNQSVQVNVSIPTGQTRVATVRIETFRPDSTKFCERTQQATIIHAAVKPTLIILISYAASVSDGHVILAWTTGAEMDNEGFNILRSETEEGPYTKINDILIPAKAIPPSGASYEFVDNTVENGKTYFYKLVDLDTSGKKTEHGPLEIRVVEGNTASLDTANETSTGAVTSDTSGEASSWFGCGFIKPTGGMRPPSSGEIGGMLAVLSLPFLFVLIRRLWRYRRGVRVA